MKRSRFNEEQIIGILKEAESGAAIGGLCSKHNISTATFYAWRKKYGGMDVSEAGGCEPWRMRTPGSSGWWQIFRFRTKS